VRCEAAAAEISARLDGAPDVRKDVALSEHLESCTGCRSFEAGAQRLRESVRFESVGEVPDLVPRIRDAIAEEPAPGRSLRTMRPLYRTAFVALASAAAVGIVALVISVRGPEPIDQRVQTIRFLRARTLLVWVPLQVPSGMTRRIALTDGVRAVTAVRSGIAWLDSWTDSHGRRHEPPRGFRYPIEVGAIDTGTYGRFVPETERAMLDKLDGGGIVLGDGGASLRGIDNTGDLTFGGSRLGARGVVDDTLIGEQEAVVSTQTGRDLGIDRVRYVLVELENDASSEDVQRRIRALATRDHPMRVRTLGETPHFRHGDAVLPLVRIKETFGEFAAAPAHKGNLIVDKAWTRANITTQKVPVLGSVQCHRRILPQLTEAMRDISRAGLASLVHRGDYGGCFFPRYLSQDELAGVSHHSWGIAFDINVRENPFGQPARMDPRIVAIMERRGFTWGGRWLVPDGMHFEFLRFP
jgi:hypothetical protein